MFQSKTNSEEVPSVFGYKPFMVLSGSMESDIHKGDLILTKETNPADLAINDVIAFRDAQNTITTHRIIDIVENDGQTYFITKGDNNSTQDLNLVAYEDVEGIYVGRIPGIGSMMDSLSKPTTIIILVFGITAIFVIGFMISTKKQRDAERREFLEYKLMKELEEKKEKVNPTNINKTSEVWKRVIDSLKKNGKIRLYTALINTRINEVNDLMWEVEFPNGLTDFNKNILENAANSSELGKELYKITGKEIHLKFKDVKNMAKTTNNSNTKSPIKDLGIDVNIIE